MPSLPLDAYLDADESIQMDSTQALRIQMMGTDATSGLTPTIAGQEVGDIVKRVASLRETGTTRQGPMMMDDLYYVVPPDRTLEFDGGSGDTVRLAGTRLDGTSPGNLPSGWQSRFEDQGDLHRTYVAGAGDNGTDNALADGAQVQAFTLTPETDEVYTFDGLHSLAVSNLTSTLAEGDLAVLFELDGQRLPSQFRTDDAAGVDVTSMPEEPDDTDGVVPFRWQDRPGIRDGFRLEGDETLRVLVRNVSGGSLSPTGGNALTFDYTASVQYQRGG